MMWRRPAKMEEGTWSLQRIAEDYNALFYFGVIYS